MDILEIILQVFSVIFGIYNAFAHKKSHVLISIFVYNILNLALMFIIKDYSTFYLSLLLTIRSIVYLFQNKLKKYKWSIIIPISIIVGHVVITLTTMTHWYQLLPLVAVVSVAAILWFSKNRQAIRIDFALSDFLWLVYSAIMGLYISCISRVIMIAASLIAFYNNRHVQEE